MKRCVELNPIVKNPVEAGILDREESRFNLMIVEGVMLSGYGIAYAEYRLFLSKPLPAGLGGVIGDSLGLIMFILGIVISVSWTDVWAAIAGEIIAGVGLIVCVIFDSSLISKTFNLIANTVATIGFIASVISALDAASEEVK